MAGNTEKKLYFFTASFPYGKAESFIENEITFLSKAFNEVIVIPLYNYNISNNIRFTPDNFKVLSPIIKNRWQHYFLGLFSYRAFILYFKEFITMKVYKNSIYFRKFIIDYCTTSNLLQSKELKKIFRSVKNDDIMYFYWGKGGSNILPFLSPVKSKKIVRFHGSDLYGSDIDGYVPIQEAILKNMDIAVFISKHGQQYLMKKYPAIQIQSVVSYLGTIDFGISKRSNDSIYRLLSCSNVIPLKRLFLLYETLQLIKDFEIEWTHIGDGSDFEKLKNTIQKSRINVKINLLGRISNKEVLMYYQTNMVDAFINVSATEGLPVSIMEAISFDIPVIATDVGGTSEIVTPETGVLLSSNPSSTEIITAINKLRSLKLHPRSFWQSNFNSEKNYSMYINEVLISKK